jgi:hypothetical protein
MQRSIHAFRCTDLDVMQLQRQGVCSCDAVCTASKHRLKVTPHLPIDDCSY